MLGALFVVAKVQEKLEKFGNKADVCGVRGILKTYQLKLKIYINQKRKNISVTCFVVMVFSIIFQ